MRETGSYSGDELLDYTFDYDTDEFQIRISVLKKDGFRF